MRSCVQKPENESIYQNLVLLMTSSALGIVISKTEGRKSGVVSEKFLTSINVLHGVS